MPTRNLFYDLPKELQEVIYEFDPTYRMVMKECLKEVEKNKKDTIFYFDANSLYHYSVRNNDEIYKLVCPSLYGRCLMDPNRLLNPNRLLLITEHS